MAKLGGGADRGTVAKIEARIRSVYDYERAVIARVLGRDARDLFPVRRKLEEALSSLIEKTTASGEREGARDLR